MAAAAVSTLGGEETAPRDTGAMMGWENYLRSKAATKTSPWRGRAALGARRPRRRPIVAAAMADAWWNPGAVTKETAPMRKVNAGRERNGPSPGRGRAGDTRRRR